jgi:hypothetical protein
MNNLRHELFDYVQRVGPMYGVEDFSVFLYSIVRMHKPKLMIELGSGSGSCSLLCALAMKENGMGKVVSVDNGAHWDRLRTREELAPFAPKSALSHRDFMSGLAKHFSVAEHVEYLEGMIPPFPAMDEEIDIIFSDYESHPAAIAALFAHFLPLLSPSSSIFIDGAPTFLPSFLFIERIISDLNRGKLPATLLRLVDGNSFDTLSRLVQTRKFTLIHLTEKKDRDQNSTAWIKIEPVDHMPYPATKMR